MSHSYETWLLHMRHDSFIWDTTPLFENDSFIWDMTPSYETWLLHMRHDSFIWDMPLPHETWRIIWHAAFVRDVTHAYEKNSLGPSSWTHAQAGARDTTHKARVAFMCDMTQPHQTRHMRVRYDSHVWVMSHMNATRESCLVWMQWRGKRRWHMSACVLVCYVRVSHVSYQCGMSYNGPVTHDTYVWCGTWHVTHDLTSLHETWLL